MKPQKQVMKRMSLALTNFAEAHTRLTITTQQAMLNVKAFGEIGFKVSDVMRKGKR